MLPSILRSSRTNAAWVRTERQPMIQTAILEAAAQGNTADAMEHALRVSGSMEVS
jgi:hypothetical protein